MPEYVYFPMKFDKEALQHDLKKWRKSHNLTQKQADEMLGVLFFQTYESLSGDQLPTVRNLIECCNMCDLDPRKYFILDDTNQYK